MTVLEFVLRLVGILIPAARRKREADAEEREQPLIDVEAERRQAEQDAKRWN